MQTEAVSRSIHILSAHGDADELARLRLLLQQEPPVRGLGCRQYVAEKEMMPADRKRFQELADRWEQDTILLSSPTQAAKHPSHREIVSMGEAAVPFILERMQVKGGHWFHALQEITGARSVPPESRGRVEEMAQAWLKWGELNGYV